MQAWNVAVVGRGAAVAAKFCSLMGERMADSAKQRICDIVTSTCAPHPRVGFLVRSECNEIGGRLHLRLSVDSVDLAE